MRWILLGLLLAAGAAVLRIYLVRDTEAPTPRPVPADPGRPFESSDVVLAAEGFEYEVIDEGVTLFFIRSNRMISDRQGRFVLDEVELRMEEDNGDLYTISSARAVYDLTSRDATLEGSVVMAGPDGTELRGEAFDLQQGGRILVSTAAPVAYRLPGAYSGSADAVRLNLQRNSLLLTGQVAIESPPGAEPPVQLTAERMLYREEEGMLRSEGGVSFTRGNDRLTSRRLSVTFDSGGGSVGGIRFIQGRWQVTGRLSLDAGSERSSLLEFEAAQMGVAFDATGNQVESIVLEGGETVVLMRLDNGAGVLQTLRSKTIFTAFTDGEVSSIETFLPAVLEEGLARPGAPPLRRLCGDALEARVGSDGSLGRVRLEGAVDYQDAELSASGDRLEGDPEDRIRLTGTPARLLAEDDEVEAREIVYSRSDGSLRATGGVRALGLQRSGVELASGDDRAPVLVTADEATWTEEPPEVAFLGEVRAWQGDSFLLADRLRIFEDGEVLEGEGGVKTVWKPRLEDEGKRQPMEVNAEEFVYRRQQRQLNFSGSVRAHEAGRTLGCEELEILMDTEGQIESLLCAGDVVVDDPLNGRTVRGSEAFYTPADRLVVISGVPVVLKQRDGTEMEGRRLRYDLDTGEVRMLSEPRTAEPEQDDAADPDQG